MHRLLAIDSGINGAACLFVCDSMVPIEPGGIIDIPTLGEGTKREVDGIAFRDWMLQMQPDSCVIEQVNAMPSIPGDNGERPRMGSSAAFNFGGTYRLLKWIPLLFNIPTRTVMPGQWKKHYNIKRPATGTASAKKAAAKEAGRQCALQRWPSLAPWLKRKLDADRAEAVLVANYHWETKLRGRE